MENYLLSDVYSKLRLQNMETMMDLICTEIDHIKVNRCLPMVQFTIWPIIISFLVKLVLFICVFAYFLWESLRYHYYYETVTEDCPILGASEDAAVADNKAP